MTETTAAPARRRGTRDTWLALAIIAVGAVLISPWVLYQPFSIPSAATEPTLVAGDYVLASRVAYSRFGSSPRLARRGDLVVFRHPVTPVTYVKRLVGLPGDRIQMRGGRLYLNGAAVPRTHVGDVVEDSPYLGPHTVGRYREVLDGQAYLTNDFGPDGDLDDTPEYVVPPNAYFMLGDNRDNSSDSRVPVEMQGVGFVPTKNLIGRIDLVVWSPKRGRGFFRP